MGFAHVFQFVNEFVVINFIERFTEVHDNDISLMANELSLTAVFRPESVLLRAKYVMSVKFIHHV